MSDNQHDNYEKPEVDEQSSTVRGRPYVGILFECCGVYTRVYRRPDQRYYVGRCPNCLRLVRLRVSPYGTSARLFRAR